MLKAILHGKAGRLNFNDENLSWREVFSRREDLLTAAFFGRLPYLSVAAQQQTLEMLIGPPLAHRVGRIDDIEFWPKLRDEEGWGYTEPDVLIHGERVLVVVEVKPPAGGAQHLSQWKREIAGTLRQRQGRDGIEIEMLILLALGNNSAQWQLDAEILKQAFADEEIMVVGKEWEEIIQALLSMPSVKLASDSAVFQSWIEALLLFGISLPVGSFTDLLQIPGHLSHEDLSLLENCLPTAVESLNPAVVDNWKCLVGFSQNNLLELRC